MAQITTLEEIERHWSINDLADANELLDIKAEYEAKMAEEIKTKSGRK